MNRSADKEHRRHVEHEPATVVIVVGVSGSGKSTVGQELADSLGVPFVDGDDLHPEENVAKMHAGLPLTETDRVPWLAALAARVGALSAGRGGVIACSALKRRYRDALTRAAPEGVLFLQLALGPETARARVAARKGHFMPSSLVASQFDEFEPLEPGEPGIALDATRGLDEKVETFRDHLMRQAPIREKVRGTVHRRDVREQAEAHAHANADAADGDGDGERRDESEGERHPGRRSGRAAGPGGRAG